MSIGAENSPALSHSGSSLGNWLTPRRDVAAARTSAGRHAAKLENVHAPGTFRCASFVASIRVSTFKRWPADIRRCWPRDDELGRLESKPGFGNKRRDAKRVFVRRTFAASPPETN